MDKQLINNLKNLNRLNNERIFWLKFSSLISLLAILILLTWDYLIISNAIWFVAGFAIIVTIIWWYWTMTIIRKIIGFKTIETELLGELIKDIRDLKENIRKRDE